jgi:imidazolonepropionase-like amidohydrolase
MPAPSRSLRRLLRAAPLLAALALTDCLAAGALAAQSAMPAAADTFLLYKVGNQIGLETASRTSSGRGSELVSSFEFSDRGTRVPLDTRLTFAADGSPLRLVTRGSVARGRSIDEEVTLAGDSATIREDSTERRVATVATMFPIAAYAPVAVQGELLRYWTAHGRPDTLAILPEGQVMISERGRDTVATSTRSRVLTRYSVAGLIWGRETLWLDDHGTLVALVSTDAEFDPFEALRPAYAPGLGVFIARAARDAVAALEEFGGAGAQDTLVALVGGRIIDGTGQAPVENGTIVVRGSRIVAAGAADQVRVPPGATRLDVSGATILPGLWDMHAHYAQVEWGPVYLSEGVTTVRDVGNQFEFITAVRDAIAAGLGLGPRILAAGIIDGTGPRAIGSVRAGTPAEAIAAVRRYHDGRFQQIKIYSSVAPALVPVITAEAHRLGMTVTGHVPSGMNAYGAVNAGFDQINHVHYIVDIMAAEGQALDTSSVEAHRAVTFLRDRHVVVDPTLALMELFLHPAGEPISDFEPGIERVTSQLRRQLEHTGAPPERAAAMHLRFQNMLQTVAALHRAGVTIVAGTDQGVPGGSLNRELELYVAAGFTPMEAIQAATLVPARVLGQDTVSGTITAGKRADLVVVDGNPLDDIRNLRRVRFTMANGVRYDPASLRRSVDFVP